MRTRTCSLTTAVLTAGLAAVALAACGSASHAGGDPAALLNETFGAGHRVTSGVVDLNVRVIPGGSSTLTAPITLRITGPFQEHGTGQAPDANLRLSLTTQGVRRFLSVISTPGSSYVTLGHHSYRLPAAVRAQLQEPLAGLGSTPLGGSSSGTAAGTTLHQLGINLMNWLVHPVVIGGQTIGGVATTRIRASIDVEQVLSDVDRALRSGKLDLGAAPTITTTGTNVIPPANADSSAPAGLAAALSKGIPSQTQRTLSAQLGTPVFEVWTGQRDHVLRQLSLGLRVPVSGATSAALGGMTSASINLTLRYTQLNEPQTITAPKVLEPFSRFPARAAELLGQLQRGLTTP